MRVLAANLYTVGSDPLEGRDPADPSTFPRRILLAVTGLSPQVVTETIYALAVQTRGQTEPLVPTEIHLITTDTGRDQAVNNLLSDKPGWFHRLCADYRLPAIDFDRDFIHVMTGAEGHPLDDIRTPADNERAADFITEKVRELTHDDNAAVHVSLAGGRKTMGFYLGYALSLFARPQDRLSHVLVSAPFESHPDFYYPTPYQCILQTRDKPPIALDARDAVVSLAEIPIVSLRNGLPKGLLAGTATFNTTVNAARASLAAPDLTIDVRTQRVGSGTNHSSRMTSVELLDKNCREESSAMKKLEYTVRFTSPAFLAEQNGQWRTPPFKALLRQWWRVAYAAEHAFPKDTKAMRHEEGVLFGHAWLEDDRDVRGGKIAARKSLVRIRLDRWDEGKLRSWQSLSTVTHPEVKFPRWQRSLYGLRSRDVAERRENTDAQRQRRHAGWRNRHVVSRGTG
ncbi:MAG: CRISPR-associated ring nuclease Csm6 [Dongiaceae bacterium]